MEAVSFPGRLVANTRLRYSVRPHFAGRNAPARALAQTCATPASLTLVPEDDGGRHRWVELNSSFFPHLFCIPFAGSDRQSTGKPRTGVLSKKMWFPFLCREIKGKKRKLNNVIIVDGSVDINIQGQSHKQNECLSSAIRACCHCVIKVCERQKGRNCAVRHFLLKANSNGRRYQNKPSPLRFRFSFVRLSLWRWRVVGQTLQAIDVLAPSCARKSTTPRYLPSTKKRRAERKNTF